MEAAIIVSYRCTNRCRMCHTWRHPTKQDDEFSPKILEKLPYLSFVNITGGEPFLRDDLEEIVSILERKARRIVVSTNGYLTERIVEMAKHHKNIGVRISIEGLPKANDELRGVVDGFDHGMRTLLGLRHLGLKDIGFGITVSDRNASDMLELYELSDSMKVEFATAVVHNSYYFHKHDNAINNKVHVLKCFSELINRLLKSSRFKNWFRAYFNYGLTRYIQGRGRLLKCQAGTDIFFIDPRGEVRPCNGMDSDSLENSFGNLKEHSFNDLWHGEKALAIRDRVLQCRKNCWMIGTAAPAMKRNIVRTALWVLYNKAKSLVGQDFTVS
jgi:radical SAM protein with 4Fe4S-binding SPASM domain